MVDLSRRDRKIISYQNKPWSKGDFSSGDWYAESADHRGNQVKFESLRTFFLMEPWQKAPYSHLDIFITSKDIYSEGMNYLFGGTIPNELTIQSVYRFRREDRQDNMVFLDRVMRHEVGHLLGVPGLLVPSNHPRIYEKGGLHCRNICQMRQSYSYEELRNCIVREINHNVTLCSDCLEEMRRVQKQFVEFTLDS
jgi:predicted Zn-dependent protease